MKKYVRDLTISEVSFPHERYVLLKLTDTAAPLPPMLPGQFVEIRVEGSPTTFLRRPISINYIDREANQLWLLIAMVGAGTRTLGTLKPCDQLNLLSRSVMVFRPCNEREKKSCLWVVEWG